MSLDRLPIAELRAILEVLTGERKPTVHLIPVLTKVIDWGYETFLATRWRELVVAGSGNVTEEEAVLALLKGEVVATDAKAGLAGGLLVSVAVRILIKAAQRMLNEVLDGV